MKTLFPIQEFEGLETPFYYYDLDRLDQLLHQVATLSDRTGYRIHYALKANANDRILQRISAAGFGADCVSGYEILKALETGFDPSGIFFAGVGKADWEINLGLEKRIGCFNVESVEELRLLDRLAGQQGCQAPVALRINPNVDANTHRYITTGIAENKFGINPWDWDLITDILLTSCHLDFKGLHFHIGSQITNLDTFNGLCARINEISTWFSNHRLYPRLIDAGGGLGVDYSNPDGDGPDFESYFNLFSNHLDLRSGQELHLEPGRALVAHSGSLISRVLFIKEGITTRFAILDAGMTELIRPALYQARHPIENLTSLGDEKVYDVVGPICESSDCFGKSVSLPETRRGDLIAIRMTGAYGETMSSSYNLRKKVKSWYSDEIIKHVS